MVGIGEPIVYDDQFLPFYCKLVAVKCFGNYEGFRNLPWETCLPEVFQVIWIDLRVHRFVSNVNYLGPPYGNYFCRFLRLDLRRFLLKLAMMVGFGGTIALDLHHI
jgi:hypothetical protein